MHGSKSSIADFVDRPRRDATSGYRPAARDDARRMAAIRTLRPKRTRSIYRKLIRRSVPRVRFDDPRDQDDEVGAAKIVSWPPPVLMPPPMIPDASM